MTRDKRERCKLKKEAGMKIKINEKSKQKGAGVKKRYKKI